MYELRSLSVRVEGIEYVEHLAVHDTGVGEGYEDKLRVRIHLDPYENQSFGEVELWANGRWNIVVHINGSSLLTVRQEGLIPRNFAEDRQHLLALAMEILR